MVGLAHDAHGGNRTGRVFTGDRSADFLFKCLFEVGFSNQPISINKNDGLILNNLYLYYRQLSKILNKKNFNILLFHHNKSNIQTKQLIQL